MFAVYGLSGPLFHGTLEAMRRDSPVARLPPVRAPRRVRDHDEGAETGAPPVAGGASNASALDAYRAMLPEDMDRGPLVYADQIMQPDVIALDAACDVARAWRILAEQRIHQSPTLDASGRLVGIVSERDLLTALNVDEGKIRDALLKCVANVMTTPVVSASPMTDIRRIARVMLEYGVDGVPITGDGGFIVGFISRTDILRAVVNDPPLSLWR